MTKKLKVRISAYGDFKKRTLAIARGDMKPSKDDPKVWFRSMESFAKVLSDRNRELLATIARTKPNSVNELAQVSGRAPSNVSRTLKTMEQYGLIRFEEGEGKARAPRVAYSEIVLDMPLWETGAAKAGAR